MRKFPKQTNKIQARLIGEGTSLVLRMSAGVGFVADEEVEKGDF